MNAVSGDLALGPTLPPALQRLRRAPAEGWLTLLFVMVMAVTVAWSLDDAAWVLGNGAWGDFYWWAAIIATAVGFVGAKTSWPRWVAHLAGAIVAAIVVPLMVGSVILEDGGSPVALYQATSDAVVAAWRDLAILNRASTNEVGHYLLAIGIIVWSVGQFAAYAVFGHRRPLDAVIVVGVVLLGNMALTVHNQLTLLVVFSIAALGVLARTHAFEEETTWVRRRIGDASTIRSIYLRGGAVFIAAAVFGSLVLTVSASSAPLAAAWKGFDRTLIDWSRSLQRYLPFGGAPRPLGFAFGDQAAIGNSWTSSSEVALTIRVPAGDDTPYYWRAVTFDRFEGRVWSWTNARSVDRAAGDRTLVDLPENPTDAYARRVVAFHVDLESSSSSFVLSPLDPIAVDQPATVQVVGEDGWTSAVEVGAESYNVVAAVPDIDAAENALTANRLRAAGTAYPPEIRGLYLQLPEDAVDVYAQRLLDEVLDEVGTDGTPYDLADAIERRLKQGDDFKYDNDIGPLCDELSVGECFARYKRGFCMHYATTMAVLLREAGVPARLVQGFLPGTRDPLTGFETVTLGSAHAWVEVFFPGYGWYAFDPTGGGLPTPGRAIADGPEVSPAPTPAPAASVANVPRDPDAPPRDGNSDPSGGPGGSTDTPVGLFVAITLLLLAGVGAAVFVAWQRGPREVTADGVWRGIARTASRFGFGPRPQQTVYEYAGALGDVLPTHRPELQAVARAKVEVAYGRHELGDDTRRALRDAQRRLRVGLLRLALRRGDRRRLRGR